MAARRRLPRISLARATSGSVGDLCERLAEIRGDRVALTLEEPSALCAGKPTVSYDDIAAAVARAADALVAADVKPDDRVAVCAHNGLDYAVACFAAIRVGAVAVPLHHHLKAAEVAAFVERSRARVLVVDDAALATPRHDVVVLALDALRTPAVRASDAVNGHRARSAAKRTVVKRKADAPAMILYTSGTSGTPKGATLTSRSLLAVAKLAALVPDVEKERGVCGLPLAHVMGMSTLLLALIAGAPLHWISKFDAKTVLARIVADKASFFVGVPAMYALLAEAEPERFDLSSVRLWASGADAMPPVLVERFRKLGCAFKSPRGRKLLTSAFAEVYGMVELSGPAIVKFTPAAPLDDGPVSGPLRRVLARPRVARATAELKALRHAIAGGKSGDVDGGGAFGIVIPPNRARIVDDAGKPVKAGVVGELVIKGPGVTRGYDGADSKSALHDGWLKTGDLAWKNRVGLIAFATRKKDVIKHGGYSVFPAEVEAQFGAHPDVAEVVVFGVAHATKGAVPAAAVVLKKGASATPHALLAWARDNIAPFKAPRSLAIVDAASIPRNANRKVLKDELKRNLVDAGALVSS